MSNDNWAWMAGLFEGEGYAISWVQHQKNKNGIIRTYIYPRIGVDMCDKEIIDRINTFMSCGRVSGPRHRKGLKGVAWSPQWSWHLNGSNDDIKRIIKGMWPWLSQRRRNQIEQMMSVPRW